MKRKSKRKKQAFITPTMVEVEDLSKLGWIVISWVGEENFYFDLPDGSPAYCKAVG